MREIPAFSIPTGTPDQDIRLTARLLTWGVFEGTHDQAVYAIAPIFEMVYGWHIGSAGQEKQVRIAAEFKYPVVEIAAALLAATTLAARGEIVLDGTLGPRTSLAGPKFAVTSDLGRQLGANLFHSFSQFNLATGESATFSGPPSIANIIGRVTGGSASHIDGLLRSTIANANLYLINPTGIVFGPNASLDVSGAFHASTADYLKFADGARFDAANPGTSTFTSAAPAAFGFLGPRPSGISVDGAALSVPAGKTLSLIGGDVELKNATLSALSGRVNLASAASAGEIILEASGVASQSVSKLGAVTLSNSLIEADSAGGNAAGAIHIRGGRLVLENSSLLAANSGPAAGGPIRAVLADEIVIDGGAIYTSSSSGSDAGKIYLEAPAVSMNNGGFVNSTANGSGASGTITLKASTLTLMGGANIKTVTTGSGAGGAIDITASERVVLSGQATQISSASYGSGAAGAIGIKVPAISVADGAAIFSDTVGAGSGGAVVIEAGALQLSNDGNIRAITEGAGAGGTIDVAAGQIVISGGKAVPAGEPDPVTGLTYYGYYSGLYVTSQMGATGNAGAVKIKADALRISDGGTISGVTMGTGDAGNFTIQAGQVALESGGLIHTSTSGTGAAGSIAIAATESLTASGRLDQTKYAGFAPRGSSSSGVVSKATLDLNPTSISLGNAGSITLTAPFLALRDGAEISTSAAMNALGGTIALTADNLEVSGRASLSSASLGSGNAGNIAIRSSNALRLLDGGSVTTEARSADGGNIDIAAATLVHLSGSKITTSVGTGFGNGGNIAIDPQFVVLNGSRIIANAYGGNGGNIRIGAQNYLASPDSVVEASSQLGIAGTIQITSPNSDVGAGLAVLPAKFFDAAAMLRESCAVRSAGSASSLVVSGRGGLPSSPEGYLFSPYWGQGDAVAATVSLPSVQLAAASRRIESAVPSLRSSVRQSPCGG